MWTTYLRDRSAILVVAWAVCGLFGCRADSSKKGSPLADTDAEAMVAFLKHETCQPTTCDGFNCETFSDGQTRGLPSHVVRCKWNDTRVAGVAGATGWNRCSYVHYSVDASNHALRNLYSSAPTSSEGCQPDKKFLEQVRTAEGYSGRLP